MNNEYNRNNFYQSLFENSYSIMLVIDPISTKIIEANDAAAKFYGYSKSQLKKMFMYEINTLSEKEIKVKMQNALNENRKYFNFKHKLANGEMKDVEVHSSFILFDEKKYVFIIVHDISDIQQNKNELQNLSEAVEQNPASIVITNINGSIEYVNKTFEKRSGYKKEEVLGQNPKVLKSGYTKPEEYKVLWQTILSGETWNGEFLNKSKTGELYWESAIITPIKDIGGKIVNLLAIKTDISEYKHLFAKHKEAEELLLNEKAKLKSIFDGMEEVVYISDTNTYEMLYMNKPAIENWGNRIGEKCYHVLQGRDSQCDFCTNDIITQNAGEAYVWEYKNELNNKWYKCIDKIIDWPEIGKARFQLAFDITKEKELIYQLDTNKKNLEEKNKELEEFVYIASHDLREPLRKIQNFGDRLIDKYGENLDENGNEYIVRMQNASIRMQTLIDDLLTYSRVTTQKKELEPINLEEIARSVIHDLSISILKSKTTIILSSLPTINADKSQMRHIFQNLISNAIKFSKPDVLPEIKIYSENYESEKSASFGTNNNKVVIVVEDNGIGIDLKYSEKIFKIFERLHGRSEYEGTGIGLSIVKKIVERYNGKIELESTPNIGTKFKIYLQKDKKSE